MTSPIPTILSQIFDVYSIVRSFGYPRNQAVRIVAKRRRVNPQTIRSACTREIGISAEKFEEMLLRKNVWLFRDHLIMQFPKNKIEIITFFAEITGFRDESSKGVEIVQNELPHPKPEIPIKKQSISIKREKVEYGSLIQASNKTKELINNIRSKIRERNLPVKYHEAKYWATLSTDVVIAALHPSQNRIRLFLRLQPDTNNKLEESPSTGAWLARFPSLYYIESEDDTDFAVELIVQSFKKY